MTKKLYNKGAKKQMKTETFWLRLTPKEDEQVKASARAKNLSVSEFVRRAALEREVDVSYEMEIVRELHEATQKFKLMGENLSKHGIEPSKEELELLAKHTIEIVSRIGN